MARKNKIIDPRKVKLGALPDPIDERDYKYLPKLAADNLPSSFNLMDFVGEIENQYQTGSCVANAACSALELKVLKETQKTLDFSRLFVYWNAREPYPELRGKDVGSYLRDAFKSINKQGVPEEKYWEFKPELVNTKPPATVYEKAKSNRVLEYRRINITSINDIKAALVEGNPVIFSTELGKKFYNLNGPLNTQKYPAVNKSSNTSVGYHAMTIVGYDDNLKGFIVENSWGNIWGDNGLCLFKYSVFQKNAKDAWVCTNFKTGLEIESKKLSFWQKIIQKISNFFQRLFK